MTPSTQREKDHREGTYEFWAPCSGCADGHPSFWKTITESPQWEAWRKPAWDQGYDWDECNECGWISQNHFQAFVKFCIENPDLLTT